ncbi:hypothetical protein [Emcibacter sp. SYSU 3D8]|uniref:hypothetical protein n=1 Tax=Emcibacter sp. SYSU 3D8 TaxID=3133969 RepID=UPI0031FF401D
MDKWKNQGEGDNESARKYNEETEAFAKSGKVGEAAKDAERALEGGERDELIEAEQAGKARSKGEDPQLDKKAKD